MLEILYSVIFQIFTIKELSPGSFKSMGEGKKKYFSVKYFIFIVGARVEVG